MKPNVPILLYHHVSPERELTPVRFEEQMRWIKEQGYKTLSMDELLSVIRGAAALPAKPLVITFDDGYLNNWLFAYPILKKYGLKAMFYVVAGRIDTDGFMTWDQLNAMTDSGIAIGSHTMTHRNFVRKDPYANLEQELRDSKALIEKHIGKPCRHLAWPWGDYESQWLSGLSALGYESAATTLGGANALGSNPFELRRINVRHASVSWLKQRLTWNTNALPAWLFGLFYGWDRRFKVWKNKESPYAHG